MSSKMKIAIVCASGIGDGLLMQIAANHLRKKGHEIVTFSNPLVPLNSWFSGLPIEKQPSDEDCLDAFDAIVLQHDNSVKAKHLHSLSKPVYTLYGSYSESKHGPLRESDSVFNPFLTMAENIRLSMERLFGGLASLDNGIVPPKGLHFRRYPKRVLIHPVSTSEGKNWSGASFVALGERIRNQGWDPVFIAPPEEAPAWGSPVFKSLADLAPFVYESGFLVGNDSGPGHLASNLGIPTLTIGNSQDHLRFWRPGWSPGEVVFPNAWVGKTKFTRNKWKYFISVNDVYKKFMKLTEII